MFFRWIFLFLKRTLTNISFWTYLKPIWFLHVFHCAARKRICEVILRISCFWVYCLRKRHPFIHKSVLLHLTNLNIKSKWYLVFIDEYILFLFISEGDDEVEEQRTFIEKIYEATINWRFHSFLEELNEAMTSDVFNNIKNKLKGKILETTY